MGGHEVDPNHGLIPSHGGVVVAGGEDATLQEDVAGFFGLRLLPKAYGDDLCPRPEGVETKPYQLAVHDACVMGQRLAKLRLSADQLEGLDETGRRRWRHGGLIDM